MKNIYLTNNDPIYFTQVINHNINILNIIIKAVVNTTTQGTADYMGGVRYTF